MQVRPITTKRYREGDDLIAFIVRSLPSLPERSVVAVTSKIVAISEGRLQPITDARTRERLIRAESEWALKTKYTWLTIKDGTVMSSAGIDESNGFGKIILLPKDSYRAAERIRHALRRRRRLKHVGVLITDSRLLPLRAGIVGVALGYAGFSGVRDYRGTPDLDGRILKVSRTDVADSLATAAVLTMGEGREQQPLALITDAPVVFTSRVRRHELYIDPRDDVYQPLFSRVRKLRFHRRRQGRT
jgi:F420-0:gamma-glutamyl ligase